jgi:hypothetical protein
MGYSASQVGGALSDVASASGIRLCFSQTFKGVNRERAPLEEADRLQCLPDVGADLTSLPPWFPVRSA